MTTSSFKEPYLQSILDQVAQDNGFLHPRYKIGIGSKPGDNYNGRIFRVEITEDGKTEKVLPLIFKVSHLDKQRREMGQSQSLFETETYVYETVLPALNNLLNKYGVVKTDIFPNTARFYGSHLEDEACNVIILEDKKADGYRSAGDIKALDADHCRHVVKAFALWHAASLALKQHDPEATQRFKKILTKDWVFTCATNPILAEMKQSSCQSLGLLQEPIRKGNPLYEKLSDLCDNYCDTMVKMNEEPADLSCIIQGDCWFNNILCKYNEDGTVQNVCLIDHQVPRFASPVVDLSYYIFVCTTKEVRDACFDELIRLYHSEVSSHLKKMQCDPEKMFPWGTLQDHLKRYGKMGVMVALGGLPVALADNFNVDLHAADDDGTFFVSRAEVTTPQKKAEISRRMTDVMNDADRYGYL